MGVRQEKRQQVEQAIRTAARRQIREVGGAALSMRAIAREVGLVSSAIYRYHPTREALLTALVVESYESLATALERDAGEGAAGWRGAALTLRRWALARPHEFQLIYGTPIPNYVAPPETIPLAARVAAVFVQAAGLDEPNPTLLLALAELIGVLTLEFGGHWTGVTDPAELFSVAIDGQIVRLGLA